MTPHHGIPTPLTSFVGRQHEIGEVAEPLAAGRLVTLVGPPGVGKTRLAQAVADALRGRFHAGIWLVELAGLAEPTLVPQAVASCFGLGDQPGRTTTAALVEFLHDRDLLLVLDNCEHLIDACAALAAEVLGSCPGLRFPATSREGLRIGGETIVRVPALRVPDPWTAEAPSDDDLAALSAYEGRQLIQDQAVALACEEPTEVPQGVTPAAARASARRGGAAASAASPAAGGHLTRREREVAALVGAGLTNREIAERLVISERTAEGHVANILARLELTRRSQIAAWAVRQGLAAPGGC